MQRRCTCGPTRNGSSAQIITERRWNAHADTPDWQIVAQAGDILKDFQRIALKTGTALSTRDRARLPRDRATEAARRDEPDGPHCTPGRRQDLSLSHGALQILGMGVAGTLETLERRRHAHRRNRRARRSRKHRSSSSVLAVAAAPSPSPRDCRAGAVSRTRMPTKITPTTTEDIKQFLARLPPTRRAAARPPIAQEVETRGGSKSSTSRRAANQDSDELLAQILGAMQGDGASRSPSSS